MKILFLNNFYYLRGGSEKVMFDEMRLLQEAGHEVAIYARGHEKNIPAKFAKYFPTPLDTEKISLSMQSVWSVKEFVYSDASRRGLREVIAHFRPDIVHAHNIYGRLSLSVLDEMKAASIPVVMTLHDLKLLCPSYLMLNHGEICERCKGNRFYNAIFSRCHRNSYIASTVYALETWLNHIFKKYDSVKYFIAPSRFLRNKTIEHLGIGDKIVCLANYVDLSSIPEPKKVGDYLLYIGRLSREKGVLNLIKALSNVKKTTSLKIVGDGPELEQLTTFAAKATHPVTFKGYLSGQVLQDAIAGARAVIMPSEWYENAPISLLEAFAYGKPVIGARIGGIPEMIDEGVNGFLFEPGNVVELAKRIEHMMGMSDEDVLAMGIAAREKVGHEFSPERHYSGLMDIYSKALGRTCA